MGRVIQPVGSPVASTMQGWLPMRISTRMNAASITKLIARCKKPLLAAVIFFANSFVSILLYYLVFNSYEILPVPRETLLLGCSSEKTYSEGRAKEERREIGSSSFGLIGHFGSGVHVLFLLIWNDIILISLCKSTNFFLFQQIFFSYLCILKANLFCYLLMQNIIDL